MSAKPCQVCQHPQRHEIDTVIRAGMSYLGIFSRYHMAQSSIRRHIEHMESTSAKDLSALTDFEPISADAMTVLHETCIDPEIAGAEPSQSAILRDMKSGWKALDDTNRAQFLGWLPIEWQDRLYEGEYSA